MLQQRDRRYHPHMSRFSAAALAGCFLLGVLAPARGQDVSTKPLRADSDAPYVHRLSLYDEDGQAIDPRDESAKPYSPKATCGKCHEVGVIGHGWHFNAVERIPKAGRRGEPWALTEPQFGVQLPVSYRGWPGSFLPEIAGLDEWQLTLRFGRQLPGGGASDPAPKTRLASREARRWEISGGLEIDCMTCHAAAGEGYDANERARQIERENLRWAPTAALGLAIIRGDAKKLPDDFDPAAPASPDYPDRKGPKTVYDLRRFDPEDRVLFPIAARVPNERCLSCHSSLRVGEHAPQHWQQQEDIHLTAGLSCTDCHRHGIDHAITRGYEHEGNDACQPSRTALSCVGCHLGKQYPQARLCADATASMLGGPLPAPRPEHRGLPPIHFEKLTCTACHAGPWPDRNTWPTQTAMAHALGLASRERGPGTMPWIEEPIFAPADDGRLAPHRELWPAYWGLTQGEKVQPLPFDDVRAGLSRILPKPKFPDAPAVALTDEQITAALKALAARPKSRAAATQPVTQGGEIVYVRDGWRYHLSGEKLERAALPHAQPYLWPMGHAVRPASQSLGVRGCTDCHDASAPLFAAQLRANEDPPDRFPLKLQSELRREDADLQRAWAGVMARRPEAKYGALALFAATGLLFVRWLFDAVGPRRRTLASRSPESERGA